MARVNQDLSGVTEEDMQGGKYDALPAGVYRIVIEKDEYKETKAGNGMMLSIEYTVLGPTHQGRKLFDNLCLEHPKSQVVQIAQAQLKALAIACGHPTPDRIADTESMHNVPIMAKVTCKKAKDPQYGDPQGMENRIIEFKSIAEHTVGPQQPPPADYGAAEASRREPQQPPLGDDEIPF